MTSVSGSSTPDLARRRDAVHDRHEHVHQHHVGVERVALANGIGAVLGLAHHLELWVEAEEHPQALTHDAVVVDDEDSYRHGNTLPLLRHVCLRLWSEIVYAFA